MTDPIFVLGLDGGGSKTICVILDSSGSEIARGLSGASNHQSVGVELSTQALREAIESARASAGSPPIVRACWGMAGLDRPEDEEIIQAIADQLLPEIPVEVVHDSTIALVGGTGGNRAGVVIIAGTGSIAVGYHSSGQMARSGGWGHLLGDEGSGYQIALQGLNAATRARDGRTRETRLVNDLPALTRTGSMEELASRIYLEDWSAAQIADLAPAVLNAAVKGDLAAEQILQHAAEELALAARIVVDKLEMPSEPFNVVLAGGIFKGSEEMVKKVRKLILNYAPNAKVNLPKFEPVIGAGMIALQPLQ
jgi:N-acetylglucosamine kinase-like BadF-type ATPase